MGFSLFKKQTPLQKLEKQYAQTLELARDLQRKGDIIGFSEKSAAADEILKQMEAEEQNSASKDG